MTEPFELDTDSDSDFETTGGELTVPSDRAPRPAVPQRDHAEDDDETVVVDRAVRAGRAAAGSQDDDTVRSATRRSGPPAAPGVDVRADAGASPSGRAAYSPDAALLREPYASRPVAPVIAARATHPARMAQPQADGEAVDRSMRGRARRRAVGLVLSIAGVVVLAAGLLIALLASLAR